MTHGHGYCAITITVIQPANIIMQFSFSRSLLVHMLSTQYTHLNSIQFTARRKIFRLLLISLTAHHPHSVSCDFFVLFYTCVQIEWMKHKRTRWGKNRENFLRRCRRLSIRQFTMTFQKTGEKRKKKIVSSPKTRNEKKSDNFKTNEMKRTKEKRRASECVVCLWVE